MRKNYLLYLLAFFTLAFLAMAISILASRGIGGLDMLIAPDFSKYTANSKTISELSFSINLNWLIPLLISKLLYQTSWLLPIIASILSVVFSTKLAKNSHLKRKNNRFLFDIYIILIPLAFIFAMPGFHKDVALVLPMTLSFYFLLSNKPLKFLIMVSLVFIFRLPYAIIFVMIFFIMKCPRKMRLILLASSSALLEFSAPSSDAYYNAAGTNGERLVSFWSDFFLYFDQLPFGLSILEFPINTGIQILALFASSLQFSPIWFGSVLTLLGLLLLSLKWHRDHKIFLYFLFFLGVIPYAQSRYLIVVVASYIIAHSLKVYRETIDNEK